MKLLTWYRGSVLPYASLWSILLRATWLNDLHSGDLYRLAEIKDTGPVDAVARGGGDQETIHLTAKLLDEPLSSFSDFCLEGEIPRWLFTAHASYEPRWCPECLRLGYHTWLMSIKLVVECPIHHVPLRHSCQKCGGAYKMSLRGLAVRDLGCRCGAKWGPEPDSMRRPILAAEGIHAWAEVSRWVYHAKNMCVNENNDLPDPKIQLALTERWCNDLEISYPASFAKSAYFWDCTDSTPEEWTSYQARTPVTSKTNQEIASQDQLPRLSVYRAMSRRLRKKASGSPDVKVLQAARSLDPSQLSLKLAQHQSMRYAFVEMLWTRSLENIAFLWRWPRRPLAEHHRQFGSIFSSFIWEPRKPWLYSSPKNDSEVWLQYHHTALECLLAWSEAVKQVGQSIDDHWADWTRDSYGWKKGRSAWYALAHKNGVSFAGYMRKKADVSFSSSIQKCHIPSKELIVKSLPNGKTIEHYVTNLSNFRLIRATGARLSKSVSEEFLEIRDIRIKCLIFYDCSSCISSTTDGVIRECGPSKEDALESLKNTVSIFCEQYGTTDASGMAIIYGFEAHHVATLNYVETRLV